MGNRMLKESIRTSKSVNQLTDFQFRLWVHLITYVDDYGRGSADPELLKGFVFPRRKSVTEATIGKALTDLATIGMIHLYEVDGESYFCFPTWCEHQRIQTKKSRFPSPEEGHSIPPESVEIHGESRWITVDHGESPPETETKPKPNTKPKPKEKEGAQARFTPPTVEEASAYFVELGEPACKGQRFVDHYTSVGWKVGSGKPMKDWHASVRNWIARDKDGGFRNQARPAAAPTHDPHMQRYSQAERKATYSAAVLNFDE